MDYKKGNSNKINDQFDLRIKIRFKINGLCLIHSVVTLQLTKTEALHTEQLC